MLGQWAFPKQAGFNSKVKLAGKSVFDIKFQFSLLSVYFACEVDQILAAEGGGGVGIIQKFENCQTNAFSSHSHRSYDTFDLPGRFHIKINFDNL